MIKEISMKFILVDMLEIRHIKPAYCCHACTQLAKKYKFENRIFTLENNKFVSALVDKPIISLTYQIKYGISY